MLKFFLKPTLASATTANSSVLDGFKKILNLILTIITIFIFFTANTYADINYGPERKRTCDAKGVPSGLEFNPTGGGPDINFVMTNPVCIATALAMYTPVKIAIAAMNSVCGNDSSIRIAPSPFLDTIDIAKSAKNSGGNPACKLAITTSIATMGTAIATLATVYGTAKTAYEDTEICGHDWYAPNAVDSVMTSSGGHKQDVQETISNDYIPNKRTDKLSFGDKTYREYYYGGTEFSDDITDMWDESSHNLSYVGYGVAYATTVGKVDVGGAIYDPSAQTCRDPSDSDGGRLSATNKYEDFPAQKYYLRGLQAGNYNCKKYFVRDSQDDPLAPIGIGLTKDRKAMFDKAHACCQKRSQEYICIKRGGEHVFCRAGQKCTIKGITLETKPIDNGSLICAQSYSVCPYNFSVSGGTQYCDYYKDVIKNSATDNKSKPVTADMISTGNCAGAEIRNNDCTLNMHKVGRCKNYCQYLTHCAQTSVPEFPYNTSIKSPYFSTACLNFTGDSLNQISYGTGFIMGSQRHFSAPIAQCVKETLENMFYNRAGHSQCLAANEISSSDGTCSGGNYVHRKGTQVEGKSFFKKIQETLQDAVKLVLILSITFYGFNILIGKADIREKKDILIFLVKIGMVLYFATGNAWQDTFFSGVYGASSEFSKMVFKISSDDNDVRRDGCQFGMITKSDGSEISSGRIYPRGKEYLALWDTLDCKTARYLGFGPEVKAANIAGLIIASGFTGGVGLYFAIAVMFFGFFLLALTIRALHIFLSSAIAIIIMVFISPIIIPTILFKKTENLFKGWLTNLISFCLQPMILFAYIAIMINILDQTVIGSARFHGPGPMRIVDCSTYCKMSDGTTAKIDKEAPCDNDGQEIIDPYIDSVACLINVNGFGKFAGFEMLGISIPVMAHLFDSHTKEKLMTILKAALVMYLLYKFADQISEITSVLIGGASLPTSEASGMKMFKKVGKFARSTQKRVGRGLSKHGGARAEEAKEAYNEMGSKGKKAEEAAESETGNAVGGAGGSGNASGGGGGGNAPGT